MMRFLFSLVCGLFLVAVCGCGTRENKQPQPGAAGHPEEMADSTRLDSAKSLDSD
jgi:hypothetical protein